MSLSSFSRASAVFTDFSVTLNAVPSGSRSCRNSSGRSDSGKNCCCTWPKPTMESANTATVASTTLTRWSTHHWIMLRRIR